MKLIYTIILSLVLTGCGIFQKYSDPQIPSNQTVHLDSRALEQCPALIETAQLSTFDEFITLYGDLATKYGQCANKQASSVKLLKQFGNIK